MVNRCALWLFAVLLLTVDCASAQEESRLARRSGAVSPAASEPAGQVPAVGRTVISPDNEGRSAFDPALAYALQRALDSVRAAQGVKGMSAAVLVPGLGVWQGVSGVSSQTPMVSMTPAMLLGIGSNTKAFVSTTILSLVDSGKIALDDALSRYLPQYPNITPSVTIRQLMNMTSGLYDYLNDSGAQGDSVAANPTRLWTPEELIRTFVGAPHGLPGGAYAYCNTDYVLLGMVINSVTGKSVSSQIRKAILTPLALDHTFLEVEESYTDPVAHPWDSGVDFAAIPVTAHFSTLWTAGGIMSTAENMARWVKGLYEGAVISRSSLDAMLTFVPMTSNAAPGLDWNGYGLGVRQGGYYGKKLLGHAGAVMGYVSQTGYLARTGTTFVVLANSSEAGTTRAMVALVAAYLKTFNARPATPGVLYAISGRTDSTRVYFADPASAALTPVGTTQYGALVGARVHPATGVLWGLTSASGWELVQIDGVTGEAFPRKRVTFPGGTVTDFKGLDFSPGGTLYVGASDGRIYSIDTLSGNATLAATTGISISGLAFEPTTGTLWASPRTSPVFRDRVYRISLPGGDTIGVGNTGFTQTLSDLAFDPNGILYGLVGNPSSAINYRLARIDKVSGSGTEIGSLGFYGMVGIAFGTGSGVLGVAGPVVGGIPAKIELDQNFPNPFNGISDIGYRISELSNVRLQVIDLLGKEVAILVNEVKPPGRYVARFDASGLASGVYLCKLSTGSGVLVKKMILER